jgi:hypothetical protein
VPRATIVVIDSIPFRVLSIGARACDRHRKLPSANSSAAFQRPWPAQIRGRHDALWVGGLVLAATGGALALVGLTLPWAAITPAFGWLGYITQLSILHPRGPDGGSC